MGAIGRKLKEDILENKFNRSSVESFIMDL